MRPLLQAKPVKFAHGPVTARAHEGITTTRVELWRRELKPWQVAAIEKGAGRGMDEFGYQRESKSQTVTDWAKATGEALVEVAFHKVSRIPCAYYHYFHPTNLVSHEKWIGR